MHYKLIVFGVVLVAVVVFGALFWDNFSFNQREISNTPLPPSPMVDNSGNSNVPSGQAANTAGMSDSKSYDDMEKDLGSTDLNVDSDDAQLQSELNGL